MNQIPFRRDRLQDRVDRAERRRALAERLYRRRFLVPNTVTLANMFCGFLAVIYAASDRFEKAAIAIGIAILLDGLDGRVARKLNATSKFGVEFDSFSDLVSFGIAPALVMYYWAFLPLADEVGVLFCFIFALCAASRLARFNNSAENLRSFEGLPTPGAAGMVAALVHVSPQVGNSAALVVVAALLMVGLAFLMVSQLPFVSIKTLRLPHLGLPGRIALGGFIALCWYYNQFALFLVAAGYVLSGPYLWWQRRTQPKPAQRGG